MTIGEWLAIFRERWRLMAVVVALALIAGVAAGLVAPVRYTATLTAYVSAQTGSSSDNAYEGALLSQQRVTSYEELALSPRVIREAAGRLGGAPADLASRTSASSAEESVLLNVSVTDSNAVRAANSANAVGASLTSTVADLERPRARGAPSPVVLRVVQPATVPPTPASPGIALFLALALVLGLAAAVAAALVRHRTDSSVRGEEQLRMHGGDPVLGRLPQHDRDLESPFAVLDDPQSAASESYRKLRTNLQFVHLESPTKVIAVTSSLPSEGKTTTVLNLALTCRAAGQRVLVVDGDLRRPRVAALLGLEHAVGLTTILSGAASLPSATQHWHHGAFDVITTGSLPPNPSELLGSEAMRQLVRELRRKYDLVLIDTPPVLPVTDAAVAATATDGAVILCRFRVTTVRQIASATAALRGVSARILGSVLTIAPALSESDYRGYRGAAPSTPLPVPPINSDLDAETTAMTQPAVPQERRSTLTAKPQPHPRGRTGP